ncbi:zinc finger protein 271-like isoform X2 [Culex pipiens pallens]|uniref:zinc finger protein 271-like isoform X2 n=1 Tax=Culex pipiens pallens TaxID=42434 RepID=UPI0022AAF49B|nr:zinc finger protein 271-like isoform X2 [Culex pipiens pallens]
MKQNATDSAFLVQEGAENVELQPDLKQDSEEEDFLPPEPEPAKKHPFQCEICDKILCNKQTLKFHALVHEDPTKRETFRCEICEGIFKSRVALKYHLKTQHVPENERKKLPCPTCGRIFKSEEGRKIHMTIQHGAGGPIFKCKECPMVFARKPHLELHMATHGAGQHVCMTCGKSYARLKDLSRHEATCGVKELCCPVCGKQLRTEQALENHRKKCRSSGLRCEVGDGERRERPKKSGSGGEDGKVRMRRSKHDRFLGLDHLADPSSLVEAVVEPARVEPKPKERILKRFQCEHCPLKLAGKIALLNHGRRRHWEAFGLTEPAPEKRGRKRTHPVGQKRKRIRNRRKIINYVDPEELPEEDECDAENEEADPVKAGDVEIGEQTIEDPVGNVTIPEDIKENVVYIEEKLPIQNVEEPTLAANEGAIKEEIIEFGEYEFEHFEGDSTEEEAADVEDETFEHVAADLGPLIPEEPPSDEVDTLDVEPANDPQVCDELVIKLEKLDYTKLVNSEGRPTYRCEECGKSYQLKHNLKAHNEKVHGITEEPGDGANIRTCKHCGQKLKSWQSLVKHLKFFHAGSVDESQFVKCPLCPAKFLNQEDLDGHVCTKRDVCEREPRERSFKCDLCRKTYSFLLHLEAHYSVHPECQNFKCDHCSNGFYNERELNKHKKNVHEPVVKPAVTKIRPFKSKYKNPFPRTECEQCGQTFAYRYRLALHRVKEHGSTEIPVANRPVPKTTFPRNFPCDQCDKSYHLQTNLTIHKAKVHGVGEAPSKHRLAFLHTCKVCKKQVTNFGVLVYHMKFKHGISIDESKFVQCPSCRIKFITEKEMAEHICLKGVVRERKHPFKCNLCDKAYGTKKHLEHHYSAHPEYHNVKCDQCPRGFYNDRELNLHKKHMHKPKDAYVECEICNKLFKNQRNLKHHQQLHMDREYCCEHCGKTCKTLHLLQSHVQFIHSNPNDLLIACTICGKKIKGKTSLKHHMKIHNNDRPFKCSFPSCGKSFITRGDLNNHVQSHTKDYKYKCKFCDYGTISRKTIVQHEQREHNHNQLAEVNDS